MTLEVFSAGSRSGGESEAEIQDFISSDSVENDV
jgi:hypothetical protein